MRSHRFANSPSKPSYNARANHLLQPMARPNKTQRKIQTPSRHAAKFEPSSILERRLVPPPFAHELIYATYIIIYQLTSCDNIHADVRKLKSCSRRRRSHRVTGAGPDALGSFLGGSIDRTFVDVWYHSIFLHLRSRRSVFDAASVVEHREESEESEIEGAVAPDHIRRA